MVVVVFWAAAIEVSAPMTSSLANMFVMDSRGREEGTEVRAMPGGPSLQGRRPYYFILNGFFARACRELAAQ